MSGLDLKLKAILSQKISFGYQLLKILRFQVIDFGRYEIVYLVTVIFIERGLCPKYPE